MVSRAVCDDPLAMSMADSKSAQVAYHGYAVHELCRRHSYEEVAYLIWYGELPDRDQIFALNQVERAQRALTPDIAAVIADRPPTAHPLDALQTAVTILGANDPDRHEIGVEAVRAKALRLFAVLPSVIAMGQRCRQGLGAIRPRADLGYAANFLYMTLGRVPEPQVVAAFEKCLILNAGQWSDSRWSTGSPLASPAASGPRGDIYDVVSARIGALQDFPHAGGEGVVEMLNRIAIPDNANPWAEEALADGCAIAGFDARPGENGDSRVPAMRAALNMLAALRSGEDLLEIYDAFAAAMFEAKRLYPGLDYPTALACHFVGFGTSALSSIVAAARLPSLTASIYDRGHHMLASAGRE